ncbi:hypothetical protein LMH87_011683 [Akanthomyces muscarius]|uniref:Uncharacterized protein n=1 Tax=Akanthomyces muscarius TaxID=2231603 RepID=A0A9W8QD04_AKAMU|nr:hypothetical protein LMH87_011683 [Akanthomyces muscarius]KAJ4150958.1 hypothetical protein LMH87_011683 [Akanthomyces muscarius]
MLIENHQANSHGPIDTPAPFGPGHLVLPLRQNSPLPSIGGGEDRDSFALIPHDANHYPVLSHQRPPYAAELAYSKYGDAVKLESALCKKVAGEEAKRPPTQRRPDQKLNIERRSNMEAFLAHMTGQVPERPCKNCHKGHGPWTECVVYDGQMCGSCTNCWYNASGSRCTYHGSGTAAVSATSPAAPALNGIPDAAPAEASQEDGSNIPFYASPKDDLKPIPDWAAPQHENESNVSSQSQSQGPEPLPVHAPEQMDYHQSPVPHGLPSVGLVLGGGGYDMTSAAPWTVCDPTRRLIHQAMGDVAMLTRRDRYIARIETAAEELAMRIAEFNEYSRTPEGMADLQHFHETSSAHMMAPGHTHDARMENMDTESAHSGRTMP